MEQSRIEYLAQFDDYRLARMANEGEMNEEDELETCTFEEIAAVEAYREAKYLEWELENPQAELASMDESDAVIDRVVIRVFGGNSAPARATAAFDCLEGYTEYWEKPVITNAYECKARVSETGKPYVEFTFSSIDFSNPNN